MINDSGNITKYQNANKIYIPQDYYNQNWKYTLNNDTVTIITNNNCYSQYSSTYCDCRQYNIKNNIITEVYQCNSNPSNGLINHNYISIDINDSPRAREQYTQQYIIWLGMLIIGILLTIALKKNSRKM